MSKGGKKNYTASNVPELGTLIVQSERRVFNGSNIGDPCLYSTNEARAASLVGVKFIPADIVAAYLNNGHAILGDVASAPKKVDNSGELDELEQTHKSNIEALEEAHKKALEDLSVKHQEALESVTKAADTEIEKLKKANKALEAKVKKLEAA